MRYFIQLSYNGKAYHGWQIQPNAITVQETLEKALTTLLGETISIVGAGRTDTGVHAKEMYAHFDSASMLQTEQLCYKLNSLLPVDIAVRKIFEVNPQAHARFDALERTYEYRISTEKNVFNQDFTYKHHLSLDMAKMNEACKILFDYRDFQCFSKSNTDVKTYNCIIKSANWEVSGDELLFTISADRFLRNMVRAIVGTMINIGLHKLAVEDLHHIIKSKDRGQAGYSVPAQGLYLTKIKYPDTIYLK
ncbi:tRNA pseudouridine(38-40) synthase TruA [Winogradskyella sp. A3E31]|uniref:tRNA pseudouridine(38-40) synthase TruA n=1 Tax=Winogradskyella sp. A3E31 TaxID=3349637 RepID=UPI00398A7677